MDLSQFDYRKHADAGFDYVVLNPETGEETDITITIVGADSTVYRDARFNAGESNKEKELTLADYERIGAEVLAKCTRGWTNIELGGEAIEFSEAAAVKLYSELTWLADQITEAINKRENFTPAKPNS